MSLHVHGNKIEKVTVHHSEEIMWCVCVCVCVYIYIYIYIYIYLFATTKR